MTDGEFLKWIASRLVNVYGESPYTDFVQKLRRIADEFTALDRIEVKGDKYERDTTGSGTTTEG